LPPQARFLRAPQPSGEYMPLSLTLCLNRVMVIISKMYSKKQTLRNIQCIIYVRINHTYFSHPGESKIKMACSWWKKNNCVIPAWKKLHSRQTCIVKGYL
jgi:hypothetical protein